MALTATASPEIQEAVSQSLQLVDPQIVSCSLNRPNIFYSVSPIKSYFVSSSTVAFVTHSSSHHSPCGIQIDLAGVASMLKTQPASLIPKTLIFTRTKNVACKLYKWLSQSAAEKQYVSMYHASLTTTTKTYLQEKFRKQSNLRCLIATIAFGMVYQRFIDLNTV